MSVCVSVVVVVGGGGAAAAAATAAAAVLFCCCVGSHLLDIKPSHRQALTVLVSLVREPAADCSQVGCCPASARCCSRFPLRPNLWRRAYAVIANRQPARLYLCVRGDGNGAYPA